MAEKAVRKNGNGSKRRIHQLETAQVVSDPQLGDVKLPMAEHPLHDFADVRGAPQVEVDTFGPDPAIEQRARAVVVPASKGKLQIGHRTSLALNGRPV